VIESNSGQFTKKLKKSGGKTHEGRKKRNSNLTSEAQRKGEVREEACWKKLNSTRVKIKLSINLNSGKTAHEEKGYPPHDNSLSYQTKGIVKENSWKKSQAHQSKRKGKKRPTAIK